MLVFAQLKGLLDLVERDVLKPGGVSFLRLDGSVEATQRFGVVRSSWLCQFNGPRLTRNHASMTESILHPGTAFSCPLAGALL